MKDAEVARAALDAYRRRAEAAERRAADLEFEYRALDRENMALKHALQFLVRSLEPDADPDGPWASRMVS
jgi:hypothetical protein